MGCGIARFGRRGLKTTETWKFLSQILSPGVSRRGAPGVSRHSIMGFWGAAQGFHGTARWGFEAQHHGVSRGSNTDKTLQWFIISRCPSRSLLIRRKSQKWENRDGNESSFKDLALYSSLREYDTWFGEYDQVELGKQPTCCGVNRYFALATTDQDHRKRRSDNWSRSSRREPIRQPDSKRSPCHSKQRNPRLESRRRHLHSSYSDSWERKSKKTTYTSTDHSSCSGCSSRSHPGTCKSPEKSFQKSVIKYLWFMCFNHNSWMLSKC